MRNANVTSMNLNLEIFYSNLHNGFLMGIILSTDFTSLDVGTLIRSVRLFPNSWVFHRLTGSYSKEIGWYFTNTMTDACQKVNYSKPVSVEGKLIFLHSLLWFRVYLAISKSMNTASLQAIDTNPIQKETRSLLSRASESIQDFVSVIASLFHRLFTSRLSYLPPLNPERRIDTGCWNEKQLVFDVRSAARRGP